MSDVVSVRLVESVAGSPDEREIEQTLADLDTQESPELPAGCRIRERSAAVDRAENLDGNRVGAKRLVVIHNDVELVAGRGDGLRRGVERAVRPRAARIGDGRAFTDARRIAADRRVG